MDEPGRRGFLRDVGAGVAAAFAWGRPRSGAVFTEDSSQAPATEGAQAPSGPSAAATSEPPLLRVVDEGFPEVTVGAPLRLDLSPARWLWLPSQRTLANTFVLFRRELELARPPVKAAGWVTADSRYRLSVNGRRVQFGPAPCDPRSYDVDPVDLTPFLRPGPNVIGAEVLFYGVGEGTWPSGKPAFLFALRVEEEGGRVETVLSDEGWRDLREHWATMASVRLNNTIGEEWTTRPDSTSQWSHTAIVPLYSLFMDVAGIRPAAPGFARVSVRPQLGDLGSLQLTARTVRGPVTLAAVARDGGHRVEVALPPDTPGELQLPLGTAAPFPALPPDTRLALSRYALPPGATSRFDVPGQPPRTPAR